jgi:hypothetical protein
LWRATALLTSSAEPEAMAEALSRSILAPQKGHTWDLAPDLAALAMPQRGQTTATYLIA